jgi:hypothetical protein
MRMAHDKSIFAFYAGLIFDLVSPGRYPLIDQLKGGDWSSL